MKFLFPMSTHALNHNARQASPFAATGHIVLQPADAMALGASTVRSAPGTSILSDLERLPTPMVAPSDYLRRVSYRKEPTLTYGREPQEKPEDHNILQLSQFYFGPDRDNPFEESVVVIEEQEISNGAGRSGYYGNETNLTHLQNPFDHATQHPGIEKPMDHLIIKSPSPLREAAWKDLNRYRSAGSANSETAEFGDKNETESYITSSMITVPPSQPAEFDLPVSEIDYGLWKLYWHRPPVEQPTLEPIAQPQALRHEPSNRTAEAYSPASSPRTTRFLNDIDEIISRYLQGIAPPSDSQYPSDGSIFDTKDLIFWDVRPTHDTPAVERDTSRSMATTMMDPYFPSVSSIGAKNLPKESALRILDTRRSDILTDKPKR